MSNRQYVVTWVICAALIVLGMACTCNIPSLIATAEPQTVPPTVTPYVPSNQQPPPLDPIDTNGGEDDTTDPDDGNDGQDVVATETPTPEPTNTPRPTNPPAPQPTQQPAEGPPLVIDQGMGYELVDWTGLPASEEWEGHLRIIYSGGVAPYSFSISHGDQQSENYLYIRWGQCMGAPVRVDVWSADGQHAFRDVWIDSPYCPP